MEGLSYESAVTVKPLLAARRIGGARLAARTALSLPAAAAIG